MGPVVKMAAEVNYHSSPPCTSLQDPTAPSPFLGGCTNECEGPDRHGVLVVYTSLLAWPRVVLTRYAPQNKATPLLGPISLTSLPTSSPLSCRRLTAGQVQACGLQGAAKEGRCPAGDSSPAVSTAAWLSKSSSRAPCQVKTSKT